MEQVIASFGDIEIIWNQRVMVPNGITVALPVSDRIRLQLLMVHEGESTITWGSHPEDGLSVCDITVRGIRSIVGSYVSSPGWIVRFGEEEIAFDMTMRYLEDISMFDVYVQLRRPRQN
jgi:hypothetical protein